MAARLFPQCRDLTFPDKSEGTLTLKVCPEFPDGCFLVTVHCPTRAAGFAVVAAVLALQHTRRQVRRPKGG